MTGDPFTRLLDEFHRGGIRFIVIGVWGANYYARTSAALFTTEDRDLLLPLDPANMLGAWRIAVAHGFGLFAGTEPLDEPRDAGLARRIVDARALVSAVNAEGLQVDLSLVMEGFDFKTVWRERRTFEVDGVTIPVARLRHIVESKAATGREKDRLFLAAHADAIRDLMADDS